MGRLIGAIALSLFWVVKGLVFVVKIVFTYFFNCGRDLGRRIRDEWKNRLIDDEIY